MAIDKYKPVYTPKKIPMLECAAYLQKIGIGWMTINEILGKHSIDKIREACLTMQRNGVNVRHREKFLVAILQGKSYP